MKRRIIALSLAIIMVFALLGGCASSGSKEKILRFGAALPLTGGLAMEGDKHQKGYDTWAAEQNKAGGIKVGNDYYKVEMKYYDYASDNATAVKLAEKLITEDKVNFILGPMGSAAAKAVSAVTEKYQIPMLAPSASSAEVFTEGYKYIFGVYTPNSTLTEPLSDIAKEKGVQNVAIIARNDLMPLSVGNETKTSVEKRGMKVVYFEQYAQGTTDFSAQLIQIKAAKPDWVMITGYAEDGLQCVKQMKELGVDAKMLTMVAGAAYEDFIKGLGKDSEFVATACWWHPSVTYQGDDVIGTSENFVKLIQEKYDVYPDYPYASAAVCGAVFAMAIEGAGSIDPKAVREYMATHEFNTFFAPLAFGESGMVNSYLPPVMQIIDGTHKVIYPEAIKTVDLVYPIPSWSGR